MLFSVIWSNIHRHSEAVKHNLGDDMLVDF